MKTDTYLNAAKANMFFLVFGIGALISALISGVVGEFSRDPWTIVVPIILALLYGFMHLLKLNYIWFSDDGDKILIRFYYVHPYMRKKKAYQIPKNALEDFDIKISYGGLRKDLILYQRHGKEIITYPTLGISLLNDKQLKEIDLLLRKYAKRRISR